jgi:acetyl esterase/lipase
MRMRAARTAVLLLAMGSAAVVLAQAPANQSGAAPANAEPATDAGYTVTRDVTYTTGANGPLEADVYIPKGAGPFPGIVFIHGGGWMNGNRSQMVKLIEALAADGYVGFTIEYDVDPVHFPASFHESLAAVKYFRAHAGEFHLDAAHVAVAGSSAGGELAALVALDPEGAPLGEAQKHHGHKDARDSEVQAALILNGALDLTAGGSSDSVTAYLGGTCAALARACKDASPVAHVHADAPPFYVGHGTVDQSVPFAEAVAFTDALKAAQVPVKFFQAQDGKHTYWADPRFYADNLAGMKAFLDEHLRGVESSGK